MFRVFESIVQIKRDKLGQDNLGFSVEQDKDKDGALVPDMIRFTITQDNAGNPISPAVIIVNKSVIIDEILQRQRYIEILQMKIVDFQNMLAVVEEKING